MFVTELGRAISLQQKFNLAKAGDSKVPHTDARSMLYESDIHLDAVGEHPRCVSVWTNDTHARHLPPRVCIDAH